MLRKRQDDTRTGESEKTSEKIAKESVAFDSYVQLQKKKWKELDTIATVIRANNKVAREHVP